MHETPQAASTIRSYRTKWLSPAGELQSCRRSPVFPGDLGGKASNAPAVWRQPVRLWQDATNADTLPRCRRTGSAQSCLQALPRAVRSLQIQPYQRAADWTCQITSHHQAVNVSSLCIDASFNIGNPALILIHHRKQVSHHHLSAWLAYSVRRDQSIRRAERHLTGKS